MGHYRAEMMCGKCGNYFCTCKPKQPSKTDTKWVVRNWKAVQVRSLVMFPWQDVMYPTQQAAEAAIPSLIQDKKEELLAEVAMLDIILGIEPGKTNICDKCFQPFTACFCNGGYY